ncbi:hypothetical protein NFI96_023017, partial [Prochilodus magdalenae]
MPPDTSSQAGSNCDSNSQMLGYGWSWRHHAQDNVGQPCPCFNMAPLACASSWEHSRFFFSQHLHMYSSVNAGSQNKHHHSSIPHITQNRSEGIFAKRLQGRTEGIKAPHSRARHPSVQTSTRSSRSLPAVRPPGKRPGGPKMFPGLGFTTFSLLFFLSLIAQRSLLAFKVIPSSSSNTHQNITRAAILQKSAEVCQNLIEQQGGNFIQPDPLTPESLAEACQSPASDSTLKSAISQISKRNAWVDGKHVFDAEYHFDDESFEKARKLITQGVSDVKTSLKQGNYEYARQRLGETMHTLQDFYSHSNWIELENRSPYPVLIKADQPFQNLADKNTPTCSSCDNDCTGNILESIISQKKLTSGYFSLTSPKKPNGKCSHGGLGDLTSVVEPKGGINKDDPDASHGSLHFVAAEVATAATKELLQDIRNSTNATEFLRLMGSSSRPRPLFSWGTTSASMARRIAEVKRITFLHHRSKAGHLDKPSPTFWSPSTTR